MKLKKSKRRDKQIIILSVLILTMIALNTSYSAFFTIKSQSTMQEISTGTLTVLTDTSEAMSNEDLMPTPTEDLPTEMNSVSDGKFAKLNLQNTGTIEADFSVSITYDDIPTDKTQADLIDLRYLKVGIYDEDNNSWVSFGEDGSGIYNTTITALSPSDTNVYPILRNRIAASTTKQYKVYVWLSEDTPTSEIGKLVYLKLDVKSTPVNGQAVS